MFQIIIFSVGFTTFIIIQFFIWLFKAIAKDRQIEADKKRKKESFQQFETEYNRGLLNGEFGKEVIKKETTL
jgi:hypothetical protein